MRHSVHCVVMDNVYVLNDARVCNVYNVILMFWVGDADFIQELLVVVPIPIHSIMQCLHNGNV